MNIKMNNLWKNDKGFVWMLVISILTLISSQLPQGIIFENKFGVRLGFFLFTLVAIRFSVLSGIGKSIGYSIATAILLLAIIMLRIETQLLILVYTILATSYMVFIIVLVVNQIFKGGIITINKIAGGVATYILLGHLWASLYVTVFILDPSAFLAGGQLINGADAQKQLSYFSFVTLTTIGYGDITAMSSAARIFTMLEGLLGQLFPAIFIAKLVSHQIEDSRK